MKVQRNRVLEAARDARNCSRAMLAMICNTTEESCRRYERGTPLTHNCCSIPNVFTALKIAAALDCDVATLFNAKAYTWEEV